MKDTRNVNSIHLLITNACITIVRITEKKWVLP